MPSPPPTYASLHTASARTRAWPPEHKPARLGPALPPGGGCPSPRGSPPRSVGLWTAAEGFMVTATPYARVRFTCACVRLYRPSPHCPPTSVQLCHLPRPSVVSLSAHEPHHAAHVGRLKSHARRTSNPFPRRPRLWGMPSRPSRPPPFHPNIVNGNH